MRRPSQRQGSLLSVLLILVAATLGWWSYRSLVSEEGPPATVTTAASPTTTTTRIPPNIDALVLYIDENFSQTPWYPSILGYEPIESDGVVVLTSLESDQVEPAVAICRAVSFWRPGADLRVVVRDARLGDLVESPRGVGAEHCRPL